MAKTKIDEHLFKFSTAPAIKIVVSMSYAKSCSFLLTRSNQVEISPPPSLIYSKIFLLIHTTYTTKILGKTVLMTVYEITLQAHITA
jgi:hypothetical protein